jgi:hypothetical protein
MALFPTQHDGQLACIKKYVQWRARNFAHIGQLLS